MNGLVRAPSFPLANPALCCSLKSILQGRCLEIECKFVAVNCIWDCDVESEFTNSGSSPGEGLLLKYLEVFTKRSVLFAKN